MKLVTRLDFDGVVCAAMIYDMQQISSIRFATPKQIEEKRIELKINDCVAHLPFHPDVGLWFHHHDYERLDERWMRNVRGKWGPAPSTAQLVYEYYSADELERYRTVVEEVNRIYSAQITREDVLEPAGWIRVYYILDPHSPQDIDFGIKLIAGIRKGSSPEEILRMPLVRDKVREYEAREAEYERILMLNTKMSGNVIVSDFRDYPDPPRGNRFLVFLKYPEGNVHLRIDNCPERDQVKVTVSKSVFNRSCETHIGRLMALFAGGGAEGAGACHLRRHTAPTYITRIIDFL